MEEYLRISPAFQKRLRLEGDSRYRANRLLFFRMIGPMMQARLGKYIDLSKVPKVFMHGNPHMDNYVRTFRGAALLDFDRSRLGPWCWDMIRFLSSLSIWAKKDKGFLPREVVDAFVDAYFTHFLYPDIPYKQLRQLKDLAPERWQITSRAYLDSNRKWAGKMRQFPLDRRNAKAAALLKGYLQSRNELTLLDGYFVDEVGATPGTLGKKHYIFSLMPKNPDSLSDAILLDIKEVYAEKDTRFFQNAWPHHGQRMIAASRIYADGVEQRLGHTTLEGQQYWGRQIPSFAVKVKKFLDQEEMVDAAYSVGSQLGKGHRRSLVTAAEVKAVEMDFAKNFDSYLKVSHMFTNEVRLAYDFMMAKQRLYKAFLG